VGNDGCGHFELSLLRFWQLRLDGETVRVAARQQRLIAVLAIRGPSLRTYIAGLLWPECPEARALESLRVSIHLVTRQAAGLLVKNGPLVGLAPDVQVDLHSVRALVKDASSGFGQAARALLNLRDAELLPGWYEDWVIFEQSRLRDDRLRALTTLARSLISEGDREGAVEAAAAAVDLEPLYESAVQAMVSAELLLGNSAAALVAYQKYASTLWSEMGVPPSEKLAGLIGALNKPLKPEPCLSAVLGFQPLPDKVQDFFPVHAGRAAVLPGPLGKGDAGAEARFAVGLHPGTDDQSAPAAGGTAAGGSVVNHVAT